MKTLSIDSMDWTGGKNEPNIGGAIWCGLMAFSVIGGLVLTGLTGGSAGVVVGSYIASNAAMAWACLTAA